MALPAVMSAVGLCAMEAWRLQRPASPLFAAPAVLSFADAIEAGDVQQAHAFIRDGQDPGAPIAVRHPVFTGGQPVLVSPLVWAVANGNDRAVLMLLGFGARLEGKDERAACLADALGHDAIARLLRTYAGAAAADRCGETRLGEPPLLSLAAGGA